MAFAQTVTPQPAQPAPATGTAPTTQMTQPATTTNANQEETVVLSPFVVRAQEDTGYKAESTLAGTRLRSDLKDIAASISVVTKDFLTDVNATDMTSLLVYTNDTEVAGYGGNYTGLSDPAAGGDFRVELGLIRPSTRVRGLATADQTRDYFLTNIPMDSYNIERVEISRGANAILFGLGSPAGIINTPIIKADTRRTKTTVTAQYGEYGSYRGTLDHNAVLIPDKLAVRVATVYDNKKYRVNDTYNRERGITATVTWKPFKDSTFRLTHEHGSTNSTKPQIRPPNDWYTWWWAAGQPVWDPTTGTGHLLGTPQAPFNANSVFKPDGTRNTGSLGGFLLSGNFGGWRGAEAGLFYLDPNSSKLGGIDIGGGQTVDGIEAFAPNSIVNPLNPSSLTSGGFVGTNDMGTVMQQFVHAGDPFATLYNKTVQIANPHIFDFYHSELSGPNQYEWSEWTNTNLTFDQTFLHNQAGIEVAYQKESTDNGYLAPADYEVQLDVNEKLPNGAPNPNFLRPLAANFGSKAVYGQDNEAYRATGFYNLDFRKFIGPKWLSMILGHHVIQANYMAQKQFTEWMDGTPWTNNLDFVNAENVYTPGVPSVSSNARIVALVNYLGPSVAGTTTPQPVQAVTAMQLPQGLQTMTILYQHDPQTSAASALQPWQSGTFGLINNSKYGVENSVRYATRDILQVHSFSAAAQSYWLNDDLVSTLGYRKDRVWSFDAGNPGFTGLGVADLRPDVYYPKLAQAVADSSSSYGLVAHLPESLRRYLPWGTEISAFYNKSDNFRLAGQRFTLTGVAIPEENGKTREYGWHISTFHNKLDFKITHFETTDANSTVNGLGGAFNQLALIASWETEGSYQGYNVGNPTGIAQFENWLSTPNGQIYQKAFSVSFTPNTSQDTTAYGHYQDASSNQGNTVATSALKASGWEYELTWNPTRNWRISGNASQTQVVRTDIAPELYNFIFGSGGLVSLIQNPDGTPTAAGNLNLFTGSGTQNFATYVYGNILNQGIVTAFAQQGTASDELIKWNYRVVTNYTFDDRLLGGILNGFGVGGAVRWSGQPLLGYGGTTIVSGGNKLVVSDINNPIYGKMDPIFDLWFSYQHKLTHDINWKIQLNIRNVGVGDELVPLQAEPDRTIVAWRIKEPQTWTLTNTFEF